MNGWSHPNALRLSPVWAPPPPGVIFPPRFPPGGPSLPPPPPPHVASSVRQPPTSTRGPAPSSADPPFPSTQPGAAGAHTPTWRCHLSLSVFTWAMRCLRRWLIGQLFFSKVCSNQDDVFDDDEKPTAIIRPLGLIDIYVSFFFYFFLLLLLLDSTINQLWCLWRTSCCCRGREQQFGPCYVISEAGDGQLNLYR